ncbi:MAG: hypothetical protein KDB02_08035 [Acidimicrobiales bacterium]|nr:hypothetical protein [Acidimicrobiales bacterium]
MLIHLDEEWDTGLRSADPLQFPGYEERIGSLAHESVRTGVGAVDGSEVVVIEGDFDVIGGSMGLVHGEKVVRAFDRAVERRLPVVVVTCSGGARMQEGMVALVQLARTAAAARRHRDAGLLSISVHLSPTTGGVLASYGSLTDLRVAEVGATIGFAGPRVVEQTTGVDVRGRSHTAETALVAGLVDAVVAESDLLEWVSAALGSRRLPLTVTPPPATEAATTGPGGTLGGEGAHDDVGGAWAAVVGARRIGRPTGVHLAEKICSSWTEIGLGVDPVVRVGLAELSSPTGGERGPGHFDGRAVVVASDRYAADGRPTPAGFRNAIRGIELAGRLGVPVVAIVDTPGAAPGPDAENDGIAAEIARTFAAMAAVPVPTVGICVGEGGSGGALAFVATDRLLIQEGGVFSVIGPEGAASILERDSTLAPRVASLLKLTAADLRDLGIVDEVVSDDLTSAASAVLASLVECTAETCGSGRRERFDRVTRNWLSEP